MLFSVFKREINLILLPIKCLNQIQFNRKIEGITENST